MSLRDEEGKTGRGVRGDFEWGGPAESNKGNRESTPRSCLSYSPGDPQKEFHSWKTLDFVFSEH